jgi:hypothetical protein
VPESVAEAVGAALLLPETLLQAELEALAPLLRLAERDTGEAEAEACLLLLPVALLLPGGVGV